MARTLLFILLGYLSGSVLYSKLFCQITGIGDISVNSKDHNPGAYNAFKNGGPTCGICCLLGDFFKAFIPVFIYIQTVPFATDNMNLALVMAAPVIGHIFPVFYQFKGGKGIASTFGVLCALFPIWLPAVTLAIVFIFFTVVLVITPNYYRSLVVFAAFGALAFMLEFPTNITMGILLISGAVIGKLLASHEQKDDFSIVPVWKR